MAVSKPKSTSPKSTAKAPAPSRAAPKAAARGSTKPATGARPTPKPTPAAAKADAAPKTTKVDMLRKKELIERVVDQTGMRKGEARKAVEATLGVLAGTLDSGQDVNLPPLGKIKVAKTRETGGTKVLSCRIRLAGPKADEALAKGEPES